MSYIAFDLGDVVELETSVATNGAIRGEGGLGDEVFDSVVGIAIIIYEMFPDA